ncbi:MAG: TlpA family protein disulfide reductase [Chloroflexota bacterium]|nr:TlpA family protein disulfide reductase [Chloroflexota bacterium]
MDTIWLLARVVLAGVFAVAGVGKLLDIPGSIRATQGFGVPERLARPIGVALPFLEILAAILLLPVSSALAGAVLALALLTAFLGGMINSLRKGEAPDCHCFGQLHSEPVGPRSIIRNAVLAALAVVILFGGTSPGHSLLGWLDGESNAVKILTAVLAVVVLAVAAQTWLIVHLLGQNGRMLIRMDELAERPAAASQPGAAAPQPAPTQKAPSFSGTGLIGEKISLESLLADKRPILLVFSDPGCGPCKALQPEIATWQREHAERLTVAMVTRGSLDDAREKVKPDGLKNVLIEKDRAISDAFNARGTPSAVLIDANGNYSGSVAAGAEAIRSLLRSALTPAPSNGNGAAAPARPRPAGPAIGSDAPAFALPDAAGETVSLDDLKGRESVLLFWNPGCGFCQRLQPDLVEWAASDQPDAPQLVTITSGTPDAAVSMTFADRVLLESGFSTGRTFGASGTPSAIRVSADGKIASDLAVGGPAILAMLQNPSAVPA